MGGPTSTVITRNQKTKWDDTMPPLLRPLVKAYLIGYTSAVGPRILTLLIQHVKPHITGARQKCHDDDQRRQLPSLGQILKGGLDPQRFPTFCALLAGGSTLCEIPLKSLLDKLAKNNSDLTRKRLSRFLASFLSAYLSLKLLQSKKPPPKDDESQKPTAGRTLDLTFFTITRALDVLGASLWSLYLTHSPSPSAFKSLIKSTTDPAIFALSSALVMWSWFYHPDMLPKTYNKWITSAAQIDYSLIQALQRCREGTLIYAKETGQAELLTPLCQKLNLPEEWGDPAVSYPFPCELVHLGVSPSCEIHAISRFVHSFIWASKTYLPLSLLLALRNPNLKGFKRAIVSAARSSAFLGTFITLFYYGVCLTRTRIGPHILGKTPEACNKIDGGICVGTGCFLCGWSILIEKPGRRKDMGMFVAPRALATLFPRRYDVDKEWRERLAFAASTAVVVTAVLEKKERVRGVFGSLLSGVLRTD
ncbi:hypothetical protein QBC38DRAFT_153086 [Podospora fimiseda]|uniref:Integral membrane protein n=1 Tax=Podospora fimiseda TaxID=252190 RepID=A0AAN7BS74_9PEZI|nr:hypothetical protein QBC38DRAFT_153086 [Podospora fimiseda]